MLCLGKVQGTGSSTNVKGSISEREMKSIQRYANGGYGKIGENGVQLYSRTASAELGSRLSIECITDMVRRCRLRHVERKDIDDWVSACRSFEVTGVIDRARSRKTWDEFVKKNFVELGLHQEWALDRVRWRVSYAETDQPVQRGQRMFNRDDGDVLHSNIVCIVYRW